MISPTVSIIIPTSGDREALLRRAIESAHVTNEKIFIEIIVVFNSKSLKNHQIPTGIKSSSNFQIRSTRLYVNNVSAARNLGIREAKGELIRFLDDDDFLLSDCAEHQYQELLAEKADLSTYAGRIEDSNGTAYQTIYPENTTSYDCAVLGPNCPALTFGTVYRKTLISDLTWNEAWSTTEDEDWMRRILRKCSPTWISKKCVVGIWHQHQGGRLSKPLPSFEYYKNRATSIIETIELLRESKRLTEAHRIAGAKGLWSAIHGGFYFAPFYWTRISSSARNFSPSIRPEEFIFRALPLPAIAIEWIMLPKRWLNHLLRFLRGYLLGWNHIRNIP